eukprot:14194902-Ditylum_brightwellii.AAC.1
MFNARSDTLYDKVSFRKLALGGNTCVVAVDGFYEWKDASRNSIGSGGSSGGKQPYFVHRKDGLPLLLAGLWTSVPTGRCNQEMMETFTILTTQSAKQLSWLHHRQPIILWNVHNAIKWMHKPSKQVLDEISNEASFVHHDNLVWHPVTKQMSNSQYSGMDCTKPISLETVPSVKQFFTAGITKSTSRIKKEQGNEDKRNREQAKASNNPYASVKNDDSVVEKSNHQYSQKSND